MWQFFAIFVISWNFKFALKDLVYQTPSGSWNVSLVFAKFWHDARYPYEVVRDKARFSEKKVMHQKLIKWDKNGPKSVFFFNLLKIH